MAVAPEARRRGVGRQLLRACLDAATTQLRPPPLHTALFVYKTNVAAASLYKDEGFVETAWRDAAWEEDVSRARMPGAPRKLLMARRTDGAPLVLLEPAPLSSLDGGGPDASGQQRDATNYAASDGGSDAADATLRVSRSQ